jgi:hypothetical protein
MRFVVPEWINQWLIRRGWLIKPDFVLRIVPESPDTLENGILYAEVRGGYLKWAHLRCPKCAEHIQLPVATAKSAWSLRRDVLGRPTITPSVWQTRTCGAHFFLRKGKIEWCLDARGLDSAS